ncbi:TPA: type II toxin-antitoxin system RelE/ParE family toxin [Escherichia coli]|uniref:type II toxin-antitoxin system RelE/ParE family toxin n=1 Tax=Escherichia coli TaxID=562 RepID=UPI001F49D568|nr:type II toxin-antitoxin system RelE/ParE family toxin [Escherichia coli]MCZ8605549.1 type II toxin-antitoxin system RelE/ParE family toxin [Escherichia albertii]
MSYEVEWRPGAIEDITTLFEYLAENASLWDARNVTERLISATDHLADYPRLYETDERYGEGVRRISLLGQHVLYGVSLDIENYCTLSSFFIISGFFGNVIFWMLRRSCGDIEHR